MLNSKSKLLIIAVLLLLFSYLIPFSAIAQVTVKTVPLRGITMQSELLRDNYFYGTKKLNGANDLTIPFMEIQDKEVNRLYRSYKTIQRLRSLVVIAPSMYFFYTLGSNSRNIANTYNPQVGWSIFVTSVAASIGLSIWGRAKMRNAVNRYNELIINSETTPQSWQTIPNQNQISIGWRHRF